MEERESFFGKALAVSLIVHFCAFGLIALLPWDEKQLDLQYTEIALITEPQAQKEPSSPEPVQPAKPVPVRPKPKPKPKPEVDKKQQKINIPEAKAETPAPKSRDRQETVPEQKAVSEPTSNELEKPPVQEEQKGQSSIEGPVAQRKVLAQTYPTYPKWAVERGIEADVALRFWVSPEGTVTRVEVEELSGYPDFDIRAAQAIKQWKFDSLDPRLEPKEQWGKVVIQFRLH